MKDKETKEMFDDLLMEVMGSYHDFMMNKISLNKHKVVEQKMEDFITKLEQEAERRERKTILTEIINFANNEIALVSVFSPISENIRGEQTGEIRAYNNIILKLQPYLAELKLKEEENGKQNAR